MADLRSMTGFARVRHALADGELIIAVKSVNHRGLDVQVHAPSAADPWETTIRALVKAHVSRGHVEVRVSLPQSAGGTGIALNRALLEQYVAAFQEAAAAHGISSEPDLNFAFRQPGILAEPGEQEPPPGCEAALIAALEEALDKL